jgi:hypothetical protein
MFSGRPKSFQEKRFGMTLISGRWADVVTDMAAELLQFIVQDEIDPDAA